MKSVLFPLLVATRLKSPTVGAAPPLQSLQSLTGTEAISTIFATERCS